MKIFFAESAWDDYLYWQARDTSKLAKINELIRDIIRNPFKGIGKPEPLKFSLSGYWSRRIDHENRLVYKIEKDGLYIIQCRLHY
jgi:toxin YoeB